MKFRGRERCRECDLELSRPSSAASAAERFTCWVRNDTVDRMEGRARSGTAAGAETGEKRWASSNGERGDVQAGGLLGGEKEK
ncbi:hypothetical protein TRAPUB_5003 [Trametes pubescens]|uniref:Uncharacterized protein n=1 Tax=Trametes pubescens TaxID=154538 RepID=A0A1M2V9N3_TRAPU|nr:hypothetical protein TRAPUB_5003 [Trametes pubescens]